MKTQKQITEEFLAGGLVLVGEYRATSIDKISWRDKETKAALSAEVMYHTVETATGSVKVNERLADGVTGEKRLAEIRGEGITKGKQVVVRFSELKTERGNVSLRGSIELLEAK